MLYGNAGVVRVPGVAWHWFWGNAKQALTPTTAISIVVLMFANVGILIGPFLLMAIRQIKAYEPGDANWGVKLEDVRGQAEAKQEITRVINLWQASDEFKKAGGKPERGLLFLGSPGTGKTMLAKGIATGFNSPFVTAPGSGFAGMFIGMDILAVQYLGWKAKKLARKWGGQCIVFIDEIDAVGMRRNSLVGGTSSQPLGTSIHDHLFFGPTGALTASGDVTLKSAAWRERMFAARAGSAAEGGTQAFFGTLGRRIRKTVDIAVPGMMGGGSGALNQLLVLMDGIDEPPHDAHGCSRTARTRSWTRSTSCRAASARSACDSRARGSRRTTSTSSARATSRSTCSIRRSRARAGSAGTSASARRSSTTGSTSSTTTSPR